MASYQSYVGLAGVFLSGDVNNSVLSYYLVSSKSISKSSTEGRSCCIYIFTHFHWSGHGVFKKDAWAWPSRIVIIFIWLFLRDSRRQMFPRVEFLDIWSMWPDCMHWFRYVIFRGVGTSNKDVTINKTY